MSTNHKSQLRIPKCPWRKGKGPEAAGGGGGGAAQDDPEMSPGVAYTSILAKLASTLDEEGGIVDVLGKMQGKGKGKGKDPEGGGSR